MLLEASGHRVSEAESVESAATAGMQDEPDVVLLDLTLPDGDGLALIPRIPRAGQTPLYIALTGRDDARERTRCLNAGCVDMLLKPVPSRVLLETVNRWLRDSQPGA